MDIYGGTKQMNTTINNNKVVIVNGGATVGKDTFVQFCQGFIPQRSINISTVDFVKKIATICGWNGDKLEKDRKFLSNLKDILTEWNDIPFNECFNIINSFTNTCIFIHCREPKEIQRFKDNFNATTILVTNPNVSHITTNHADDEVYDYVYDYIICNIGSKNELKLSAQTFVEKVVLEVDDSK